MVTPVDAAALTRYEPSKKRKLSETIEPPPPKPNLWSRYGTLIVNTKSNAHCIRAELLLRHSKCADFRALILSDQNHDPTKGTLHNITVPEADEDWQLILSLLAGKTRMPGGSSFHVSMALPILSIGHKYGFLKYKLAALQRLESILGREQLEKGNLTRALDAVRGYEFRLLDIVREQGLDHLHPVALYICSIVAEHDDHEIDLPHGHHLRSYELSNLLSRAQKDLAQGCRQYTLSWWFGSAAAAMACKRPKKCMSVIFAAVMSSNPMAIHALGPRPEGFSPGKLCKDCRNAEAIAYEAGRINLLYELPKYFGLRDWPKVLTMSNDV